MPDIAVEVWITRVGNSYGAKFIRPDHFKRYTFDSVNFSPHKSRSTRPGQPQKYFQTNIHRAKFVNMFFSKTAAENFTFVIFRLLEFIYIYISFRTYNACRVEAKYFKLRNFRLNETSGSYFYEENVPLTVSLHHNIRNGKCYVDDVFNVNRQSTMSTKLIRQKL